VASMQMLIRQSAKWGGGKIECPESAKFVSVLTHDSPVDDSNRRHFKALWADPIIRATYNQRRHFQLLDCCSYFFDKLDELGGNFLPSDQDVLRCRIRTIGIVEQDFSISGQKFKFVDVGGQKNERKKWIHCFEGVAAVLFVGVLSEYDLTLFEDDVTNRMEDSLQIFQDISNSPYFTKSAIILFLNKRDVFAEKVKVVPLNVCPCFSNYTGPNTYEAGCDLIQKAFHARNSNPSRQIYTHITCATDSSNMRVVMTAVNDFVIQSRLNEAGFV